MYLLTRKNKVIDYCDAGYNYVGNIVVCESKGCIFEDATIVYTEKEIPSDINEISYLYINGEFVRDKDEYIPVTGGAMTGVLKGHPNDEYMTPQFRNITMSTEVASGGYNGQIHFQYE